MSALVGRAPRVAIGGADAPTRLALARCLDRAGYRVEAFTESGQLLAHVEQGGADVVLSGSLRDCRALKSLGDEPLVPVILLVLHTDLDARCQGIAARADACLEVPLEESSLLAQVSAMLHLKRAHDALLQAKESLRSMALRCPLTGVHNYRYLNQHFPQEFAAAEERREPLACVHLDVDGLREHNVAFGRAFGDAVLQHVARAARSCVRGSDVIVRYGPDEFLLLLPATQFASAMRVAGRVLQEVHTRPIQAPEVGPTRVHVSMGVAVFPGRAVRTRSELLRAAGEALADAKRSGGGCVAMFQRPVAPLEPGG